MGAFSGATDFFGMPLSQLARRYRYAEDNICILEGDLQKLREQFSETYENLCSCTHQADQRSPLKYGQDLVASWLVEDVFLRVSWGPFGREKGCWRAVWCWFFPLRGSVWDGSSFAD